MSKLRNQEIVNYTIYYQRKVYNFIYTAMRHNDVFKNRYDTSTKDKVTFILVLY